MNKNIAEHELDNRVQQLKKEMNPKRDLWTGIEKAIAVTAQEPSNARTKLLMPSAWAASVVAAVLVAWVSFNPLKVNDDKTINIAQVMQNNFTEQKQLMLTSFGQPELKKLPTEMQAQLTELAGARSAIKKALKNDPNNSELLNLLGWTQKQELDLLKQLYSPQWQTI
jgi:hypothetical protein